uniref:Uncharacterized protein n=1 Tax=viral metagenome TaxID=1070528 RepID=A0A6H2A0L9_9ZZZZ
MKLLNGEIFEAKPQLDKLLGKELPVKVAYGLAKMANKLNVEFQTIELVRNGLIKKYGEADKDNPMQISVKQDGENFQKFVAEFTELMNQEVEVVIEKVKLPIEVDGKPFQLEANILMALEKFIEVE